MIDPETTKPKAKTSSSPTGARRLAVLLGVADYSSPNYSALPVCKKDAEDFRSAVEASGRYSDILCITDNLPAHVVKKQISDFLLAHSGKGAVDQVLFYFSGHGEFDGVDFRYLLGDYDESKKNLTSLSQSELDRQLRMLSPAVCVKVVDACHSGTLYLKAATSLEDHLGKSQDQGQFRECYFYFSSLQEQTSFTGTPYSAFTEAVLSCFQYYQSDEIRFLDLASYIQDSFPEGSTQRPTSFLQGPGNQIFLARHAALKKVLDGLFPSSAALSSTSAKDLPAVIEPTSSGNTTLSRRLGELAAMSGDVEEVAQALLKLREAAEHITLSDDLTEHFAISVDTGTDLSACPQHKAIAEWVNERRGQVWATPTYRTVQESKSISVKKERQLNRRGLFSTRSLLEPDDIEVTWEPRTVYEDQKVIDSFKSGAELPYRWLMIKATFVKPIVPPVRSYIIPLASRSHVHLFCATASTTEVSPDSLQIARVSKWQHTALPLRDSEAIVTHLAAIARQLESIVQDELDKVLTRLGID